MNPVACMLHVSCSDRMRQQLRKMRAGKGGGSGRVRGGIWEKKHGKNNRKGKLRDQA